MMRRGLLAVFGLLSTGACDNGPIALEGTWSLTRVNGQALPVVVMYNPTAPQTTTIQAGELTIAGDGNFTMVTATHEQVGTVDVPASNNFSKVVTGTVSLRDSIADFSATGGEAWAYSAIKRGAVLTLTVVDRTMEYRKKQ